MGTRVRKCSTEQCWSTLLLKPQTLLMGCRRSQSGYFWVRRWSKSHFSAPCPHSHFNFLILAGICGVHSLTGLRETTGPAFSLYLTQRAESTLWFSMAVAQCPAWSSQMTGSALDSSQSESPSSPMPCLLSHHRNP